MPTTKSNWLHTYEVRTCRRWDWTDVTRIRDGECIQCALFARLAEISRSSSRHGAVFAAVSRYTLRAAKLIRHAAPMTQTNRERFWGYQTQTVNFHVQALNAPCITSTNHAPSLVWY